MQTSPPLLPRIAAYLEALAPVAPRLLRTVGEALRAMAASQASTTRPPEDDWADDDTE